MTAPMTLEQAIAEARRRGLWWVAQDGPEHPHPNVWWGYRAKPRAKGCDAGFSGAIPTFLGTGSPNPDGWRETCTEVK